VTDLFSDAGVAVEPPRQGVSDATLREIHRTGKARPKRMAIAIAHGLAYDPHVDGRLRLTPVGREKLA
jgi:hypothetical protein